ncbi:LysR family transcriptional regulator [Sphaerotilus sp.]|uniref:LysR family transcriptional regulator n=1 Tax=Sphaerotilus sp. TaxID=2093942 RepID=UPI002ACD6C94|nr:LysR family transcriptional regulator [Sphaerotilus sp.]MDZ7858002.1 LysR family transcriptional regulator [Sphaerotilus sp.]
MNLLDAMRYLAALAQHRHFGRAAEACHITQPALSNAVRALEQEFGVTVVRRGRQYEGLTPEGERVLASAHRMLHEREALRQELSASVADPGGPLVIACVPTAVPVVARLAARLRERHPGIRPSVRSLSSAEIETGLEQLSFDLALGYADRARARAVKAQVVATYGERYVLLRRRAPGTDPEAPVEPMRWADAARLDLCMLTREMHNRHIVDEAFAQAGAVVRPVIETNSVLTLMLAVLDGEGGGAAGGAGGGLCSVMPGVLAELARQYPALELVPLVEPDLRVVMGLLLPQGGRLSLAQQAATTLASEAPWWRGVVGPADAAAHHSTAVSGGSNT